MIFVVRVLDTKFKFQKEIRGIWKDGHFTYKEGALPFLGLGGTEKKLNLIYDQSLDLTKVKEFTVIYDGKDYKQISYQEIKPTQADTSLSDVLASVKMAELTKNAQLTKPMDLKDILNIVMFIVMGIMIFLAYEDGNNVVQLSHNLLIPLNQSLQQNTQLMHIIVNLSNDAQRQSNATYSYLVSHGG